MLDKHGNSVEIGDVVRVLEICSDFYNCLPEEEKPFIAAMLNNQYPIDDFPETDKASVSIEWKFEDGTFGFGGLYMLSHEFELVTPKK